MVVERGRSGRMRGGGVVSAVYYGVFCGVWCMDWSGVASGTPKSE